MNAQIKVSGDISNLFGGLSRLRLLFPNCKNSCLTLLSGAPKDNAYYFTYGTKQLAENDLSEIQDYMMGFHNRKLAKEYTEQTTYEYSADYLRITYGNGVKIAFEIISEKLFGSNPLARD